MTTRNSLDAYRSHELSIQIKTSSGDNLSLNFENSQSLSLNKETSTGDTKQSFSFSSLQAFSFKIDSNNGISEQDQKEIDTFMKKAQPFIDKFMKELEDQNQTSPINKVASDVTKLMGDLKERDIHVKNLAKKELVDIFDASSQNNTLNEKMIDEAQKLLQKIIDGFDSTRMEPIYA